MGDKSGIEWTDATDGRRFGVLKTAAKRLGLDLDEYLSLRASGLKPCCRCKKWKAVDDFGRESNRGDGRDSKCKSCRSVLCRMAYRPKEKKPHGWTAPARDGDKLQARRRVNYLVEQGRIAHPNSHPCSDCGHVFEEGARRHEYDHARGYSPENQLYVEPVCSACHAKREVARRGQTN